MTNIEFYKNEIEKEISKGKTLCAAINKVAHYNGGNKKVKHCLDYGEEITGCYKCSRDVLDWMTSQLDWNKVKEGTPVLVSNDGETWNDGYCYICTVKGKRFFDLKEYYDDKYYGEFNGDYDTDLHLQYWKYAKVKGE